MATRSNVHSWETLCCATSHMLRSYNETLPYWLRFWRLPGSTPGGGGNSEFCSGPDLGQARARAGARHEPRPTYGSPVNRRAILTSH